MFSTDYSFGKNAEFVMKGYAGAPPPIEGSAFEAGGITGGGGYCIAFCMPELIELALTDPGVAV